MLTDKPLSIPPTTCNDCEYSFPIFGKNVAHLCCCTKYETHVDLRQGTCPFRDDISPEALRVDLLDVVTDWVEATEMVAQGDIRSPECIVRQRRHATGRRLSMDDTHYAEDHS